MRLMNETEKAIAETLLLEIKQANQNVRYLAIQNYEAFLRAVNLRLQGESETYYASSRTATGDQCQTATEAAHAAVPIEPDPEPQIVSEWFSAQLNGTQVAELEGLKDKFLTEIRLVNRAENEKVIAKNAAEILNMIGEKIDRAEWVSAFDSDGGFSGWRNTTVSNYKKGDLFKVTASICWTCEYMAPADMRPFA